MKFLTLFEAVTAVAWAVTVGAKAVILSAPVVLSQLDEGYRNLLAQEIYSNLIMRCGGLVTEVWWV